MLYRFEFLVKPRYAAAEFPLDMLRFDACIHASEEASRKIAANIAHGEDIRDPICLLHWTNNPNWRPTEGRWGSFGWLIVPGSLRKERY